MLSSLFIPKYALTCREPINHLNYQTRFSKIPMVQNTPNMSRIHKSLKLPDQILKNPDGLLHKVYSQARDLLAIQSVIRKFVPANVYVASLRNETLHLITSSAAAATQITYRQRNIIAATRRYGAKFEVSKLKVSVRPEDPELKLPSREPIPPSVENAQLLATMAKYIEDGALRKALINLSKRGK